MKGKNQCQWLTIGFTEHCGKSCLGEHCKVHLARLRKGLGTQPCSSCGKGVKTSLSYASRVGTEQRGFTGIEPSKGNLLGCRPLKFPIKQMVDVRYTYEMTMSMDEYIDQLLAQWKDPTTLRTAVQNILDEPIPEAMKTWLLKPLLPRPIPPTCKHKLGKRQAVLREFDPLHDKTKCELGVKRRLLLPLVAYQNLTNPPQYVLLQEVNNGALTDYGAVVPMNHCLEADTLAFPNAMTQNTMTTIEKDLNRLGGLKFTLTLAAVLEKLKPGADENEEPDVITTIGFFGKLCRDGSQL